MSTQFTQVHRQSRPLDPSPNATMKNFFMAGFDPISAYRSDIRIVGKEWNARAGRFRRLGAPVPKTLDHD